MYILDHAEKMTNLSHETNEVDQVRGDKQASLLVDDSTRHMRLDSFVHRYGIESADGSTKDQIERFFKKQCASFSLLYCLNAFLEKMPLLRCLKEYNIRKDLFGDIIAGITVAIMHIPQGMAYGVLTTLPPVHGKRIFEF